MKLRPCKTDILVSFCNLYPQLAQPWTRMRRQIKCRCFFFLLRSLGVLYFGTSATLTPLRGMLISYMSGDVRGALLHATDVTVDAIFRLWFLSFPNTHVRPWLYLFEYSLTTGTGERRVLFLVCFPFVLCPAWLVGTNPVTTFPLTPETLFSVFSRKLGSLWLRVSSYQRLPPLPIPRQVLPVSLTSLRQYAMVPFRRQPLCVGSRFQWSRTVRFTILELGMRNRDRFALVLFSPFCTAPIQYPVLSLSGSYSCWSPAYVARRVRAPPPPFQINLYALSTTLCSLFISVVDYGRAAESNSIFACTISALVFFDGVDFHSQRFTLNQGQRPRLTQAALSSCFPILVPSIRV